jgi:CYTH domain-containing protein
VRREEGPLAIEREIRFLVTDGDPPAGGVRMRQAYLLRGPATLRVRQAEGGPARMTVKAPHPGGGRFEWEWRVSGALTRALLRLPLPRVEKTRARSGRLEVDVLSWPPGIVLVELELDRGEPFDLTDPAARARLMEAHRPGWVRAWRDVTDDPAYTNARLARRPLSR